MSTMSQQAMVSYLSKSISSINANKINGLLAEVDFRNQLALMNLGQQVSAGGWVVRSEGPGTFAHHTIAFFPRTIDPSVPYLAGRTFPAPPNNLHTICSTLHQIGIHSYFCEPEIAIVNDPSSISWQAQQLGVPATQPHVTFPLQLNTFNRRAKKYNFLKYNTVNANLIPAQSIPEEFSKEHLRITFQNQYMSEISDIDGIFWGQHVTYPLEIKEKTAASDKRVGEYFGIDVGPFVKLAHYAARKGNLNSLFFVREINNTTARQLVDWWFITFENLARFASWVPLGGGTNMGGGGSTTIKIPKAEFTKMTAASLAAL